MDAPPLIRLDKYLKKLKNYLNKSFDGFPSDIIVEKEGDGRSLISGFCLQYLCLLYKKGKSTEKDLGYPWGSFQDSLLEEGLIKVVGEKDGEKILKINRRELKKYKVLYVRPPEDLHRE